MGEKVGEKNHGEDEPADENWLHKFHFLLGRVLLWLLFCLVASGGFVFGWCRLGFGRPDAAKKRLRFHDRAKVFNLRFLVGDCRLHCADSFLGEDVLFDFFNAWTV